MSHKCYTYIQRYSHTMKHAQIHNDTFTNKMTHTYTHTDTHMHPDTDIHNKNQYNLDMYIKTVKFYWYFMSKYRSTKKDEKLWQMIWLFYSILMYAMSYASVWFVSFSFFSRLCALSVMCQRVWIFVCQCTCVIMYGSFYVSHFMCVILFVSFYVW